MVWVELNRSMVTPGADLSAATVDQAGNSSICAWPPLSWSSRVLSLGTSVQVTLFR